MVLSIVHYACSPLSMTSGVLKQVAQKSAINRIDVYNNPKLMQIFNSTLQEFAQDPKRNSEPVWVFHGTTQEAIDKIMYEGFKVGGTEGIPVRQGRSNGAGIYTSLRSDGALHQETKRVILCKALKGFTSTVTTLSVPHDSVNPHGGHVFVFREPRLILPVYVIHFT